MYGAPLGTESRNRGNRGGGEVLDPEPVIVCAICRSDKSCLEPVPGAYAGEPAGGFPRIGIVLGSRARTL